MHRYRNIVVLTGAGISQSAGLPTYRGPGGLWSDPSKIALSAVEAMTTRRAEACAMFWQLYASARGVAPSPAHRTLAAFEAARRPGTSFTLITQNVDGLHQAAGSRNVVEFHGSLARWRCEQCGREHVLPEAPACCGEPMRPCVVLFGEMIPVEAEHAAKRALRDCDLFVAIGTSGTVVPAASFVRWAAFANAHRVLLNLEISDEARGEFSECRAGHADSLVGELFGALD